jgi:DNA processing protein
VAQRHAYQAFDRRRQAGARLSTRSVPMNDDLAVALSLADGIPRVGLTDRLRAHDPVLLECAAALVPRAREVRAAAAARGIQFLGWNAPGYPSSLLNLTDAPPGLWYRGTLACLAGRVVAIIGSRSGSSVALETAGQLARELAARGIVVVSGLARGVDSAAHRGALASAGSTVAVLGSGLDRLYPPEHKQLAAVIEQRGAVVSEFPPDAPPLPFHFPLRNRIISGLSRAIVVIEASEKSGSLITVSCALEQGKDVMAVPGNVLGGRNRGGHALIRDGAKIVESADDIVEELGWTELSAEAESGASADTSTASGDHIVGKMQPGLAYEMDELSAHSGVSAAELLTLLTRLELGGVIRRVPGGRFVRAL